MEYKNILLGYPIIFFTDHKNNNFNGLKGSDRVLHTCWLLLLEEYGVTFEYLPGKKNNSLRIRKQQHQYYQINNPNAYCLDLQRTSKSQGTTIKRKGLSPTSLLNTTY
jgi:hypothetical protein